jgi:hypothetical protein
MPRPKGSKNRVVSERQKQLAARKVNPEQRNSYAAPTKDTRMNFAKFQSGRSAEDMFAGMTGMAAMVAKKISPSLVITGQPGLGKTYQVVAMLEQMGMRENWDFVHVKGRASAAGMFITLYENRDKLIIFDDCDSVFRDVDAVNVLKGALDSYDRRVISWISAKPLKDGDGDEMPRSFTFTGQVIFISNMDISRIDPAIRSRSFVTDISLTNEQMIQRMRALLKDIEPKAPMSQKAEALEALIAAYETYAGVELNFRSLIKSIRIRQAGFGNWKQMIAEQVMGI